MKKDSCFWLCAIVLTLAAPRVMAQRTLYVSQTSPNPTPPYTTWDNAAHTIQEAVDAAGEGDTVLVAEGEYRLAAQISIAKAIVLRSNMGPDRTLLNGQNNTRCLWISNSVAVVDGFKIWRGYERGGGLAGGVVMIGGTLSNCIVQYSFPEGRLVYCSSGGLVTDCQIGPSSAVVDKGAGVYLTDSQLRNSVISGMRYQYCSAPYGAGVYAVSSTISGCTISSNGACRAGGGVYLDSCEADRCIIMGNSAGYGFGSAGLGGGIFATNSVIRNSLIAGNRASNGSGSTGDGTVPGFGGGVYLSGGSLLNCTVTGNTAYGGGGVYVESGGVRNSILYFNSGPSNANWYNLGEGTFDHVCTTPDPGGVGILVEDPQFVDRTNGNYRLGPASPCADAGVNEDWMLDARDLDDNPRIVNGTVDLGALERGAIPTIFNHPQSQTVTNGSEVTFSVTATGSPPLTYHWLRDRATIPAGTNSILTLSNVTSGDAGVYSVIVSNMAGSVVSSNAVLTVLSPPVVAWIGPTNGASYPAGSDILLTARATDSDGSVSFVEFFANSIKLGQAVSTTDVYEFVWSNAPSGNVQLHAEALDNDGARGISDSVQIVIGAPWAKLNNPSLAGDDRFGHSVAVSGSRVVVGAPFDETGASRAGSAYVYQLAGGKPPGPAATLHNPSPASSDQFGAAVAISGPRVVVGAPGDDTGGFDAGSAYVYNLNSATPTTPDITLNNPDPVATHSFGSSVAISGAWVVIGQRETAYVYRLGGTAPAVPVVVLKHPNLGSGYFGSWVAISGSRVVIGAPEDDTGARNAGSAYVYDLDSASPTVPIAILNNPSPVEDARFGWSVAISDTRIVVGAYLDYAGVERAGSAYVYDLASSTPTVPLAKLTDPSPRAYDYFGWSVAISGTRIVVAAPVDDIWATDTGSAHVYDLNSSTPTVPEATLTNPNSRSGWFGWSVSISGARVLVGSPEDADADGGTGRAYVYDLASDTGTSTRPLMQFAPHQDDKGSVRLMTAALPEQGTIIVEKSTDLMEWQPIQTNTITGDTFECVQPIDPGAPPQFFRALIR